MIKKTPQFNNRLLLFVLLLLFLVSAAPLYFAPGLTAPEAINPYLNGNFPSVVEDPYEIAFPGVTFDSPLNFNTVPNNNKIVVGQRNGEIYWFENNANTTSKNLVEDLSDKVGYVWDGGFLGLAIHPDFGSPGNNYFFVFYTTKDANGADYPDVPGGDFLCTGNGFDEGNFLVLEKFEVDPVTLAAIPNTNSTMLRMKMYGRTHRGGGLVFGDNDYLYLTTGDQTTYTKSQDIENNLDGGVLRLDVNMDPINSHPVTRVLQTENALELSGEGYFIPNDNPFAYQPGVFEEYYTLGHRNPHRLTYDNITSSLYIGEVGGTVHEEINVISSEDAGANYGWPLYEGLVENTVCISELRNNDTHKEPLVAFPRNEANAIIGGYVYRGSELPSLQGKYICADWGVGEDIWAVDLENGSYELIGNFLPENIISFGENYDKELYMLKEGDDINLYKLKSAISADVPTLLSETGAFTDLTNLTPEQGLIPYELIESFWSDGAYKKRWLAIPNDGTHDTAAEKIIYSEEGVWDFPIGSVLVKHFDYPIDENNPNSTKKIETRFSIKGSNNKFYFLTYRWNEEETDATLQEIGANRDIQVATTAGTTENRTWRYPSSSECIACHNNASKGSLGPRARYLNKDYIYPNGGQGNQLVTLSYLGILDQTITDTDTPNIPSHKRLDDESASTEEKARSYLDLNCAYCHRPGTGIQADFDLRILNSLAETGLLNAGINNPLPGLGSDQKILFAGDASKSQLFHRPNELNPNIMMPPLAKSVVDEQGVAMIEEWINQMNTVVVVPPGTYQIVNKNSDLTMEVQEGGTMAGDDIVQGTYEGQPHQEFDLSYFGDDIYKIATTYDITNEFGFIRDGSIDISGGAAAAIPGTNIQLWEDNGTDAQRWEIIPAGDGYFYLKSNATEYFLGIENEAITEDSSIKVLTGDGSDNLKWRFNDINATNVLSFEEIDVNVSENQESVTFDLSFSGNVPGGFTIDYTTSPGSAQDINDFITTNGTLEINGADIYSITVNIIDDALIEDPENFSITLSNPSISNITIDSATATATIIDNDAKISFESETVSINEGDGSALFRVQLEGVVPDGFILDYNIFDDTALSPEDYEILTGTLNFIGVDGEYYDITVPIVDDDKIEPEENFIVTLSGLNSSLVEIESNQAIGEIIDDDLMANSGISFDTTSLVIDEEAGTISLPVTLIGNVQGGFTIDYSTENDSATSPMDFAENSGTLTFAGLDGESHSISIGIIDDTLLENTETFTLNLVEISTNLIDVLTPELVISIIDNDENPGNGLSFVNTNIAEIEDNQIIFTVVLTGDVQDGFTVDYNTSDGSAEALSDYLTQAGTLVFQGDNGESYDIVIDLNDDVLIEETEDFNLILSNLSTDLISINTENATGNIIDNDQVVGTGLSFEQTNYTVSEDGGILDFTIVLNGDVSEGFTLEYETVDGLAVALLDYVSNEGILEFEGIDGETKNVSVIILEDNLIEQDEFFILNLFNLTTDLIDINTTQALGTIIDNDVNSENGISFEKTEIIVNEEDGIVVFTVLLNGNVPGGFTLDYSTFNGTAIAPNDYINANGRLDFNGNNGEFYTIEVPINDDSLIEDVEFFELSLFNLSTSLIEIITPNATGSIIDNDIASNTGISFENNSVNVTEDSDFIYFTVRLIGDIADGFTVDYNTVDDTALSFLDYSETSGILDFDGVDGEFREVAIPIIDDFIIEDIESFAIELSNISNPNVPINTIQAFGNIIDDDGVEGTGISFNQTELSIEEGIGVATIFVELTGDFSESFTLQYSTSNGSAISPNDYSNSNGTLSFNGFDGEVQEIMISISDDTLIESNEDFVINLFDITSELIPINTPSTSVIIVDNDTESNSGLSFTETSINIDEDGGSVTFTLALEGDIADGFTVDYNTVDDTALSFLDYSETSGILNFDGVDGEFREVVIPIIDDFIIEDIESFAIELSNISNPNVPINTIQAFGNIIDDDGVEGTGISFNQTELSIEEGIGVATIFVELTGDFSESFTLQYSTSNGSAISPNDYSNSNGTLSFNGFDGEVQEIMISISDDTLIESNEDFVINLFDITSELIPINTPSTSVIIVDNDTESNSGLSFTETSINIDEDGGSVTFTLALEGDIADGFTVDYFTEDLSASAPEDYKSSTGTLSFIGFNGETKEIIIDIVDDVNFEENEQFQLNLNNPSSNSIALLTSRALVQIIDNDLSNNASLSFTDTAVKIREDEGTALLTLELSGDYVGGFSMVYATSDLTAITPKDYIGSSGIIEFEGNDGEIKEISIIINDDVVGEIDEDFMVLISNLTGETIPIITPSATVTITDDETAENIGLSFSQSNISFNEDVETANFTVLLQGDYPDGFTIDYSTSDSTAIAPSDYKSASGTLMFEGINGETKEILISINDDTNIEGSEEFMVNLFNISDGEIPINTPFAIGTINEDLLDTNSLEEDFFFKLYPNPLTINDVLGVFFNSGNASPNTFQLEIHSIDGSRIFVKNLNLDNNENEMNIDLAPLTPGVYLVTITTIDERATKKLIIRP